MNIIQTGLKDVILMEPPLFSDNRGYFTEVYKKNVYDSLGIKRNFVQDNLSCSSKNVLRGLHYQITKKQAKLVQAIKGEIFDVAVDLRPHSETFGKWEGFILSDKNNRRLFIPEDFAHGFCALSDTAYLLYKCSEYYAPDDEGGIIWCDDTLNVKWPVKNPIISEKDIKLPSFSQVFGNIK